MTVVELDKLRESVRARRSLPAPHERRRLRVCARLSRAELAEAIHVSEKTIARWERDERTPHGANAERYAAALHAIRAALEDA